MLDRQLPQETLNRFNLMWHQMVEMAGDDPAERAAGESMLLNWASHQFEYAFDPKLRRAYEAGCARNRELLRIVENLDLVPEEKE